MQRRFSPASASWQMQMCMAHLQICTTAAALLSKNKQGASFLVVIAPCWQSWVEKCWEVREVKQHCGLPTVHLQAVRLERDAAFVLPAHKFYSLSPEAARATCSRWRGLGEAQHSPQQNPSNKAWLGDMEACTNELWMADHYPLIKTETQKFDESNKTVPSRDNYNFI